MSSKEKNIKTYNKKADDYDNTLDGKFTEKFKNLLVDIVNVNDGDFVLDVGCGNGTLLSKLSRSKSIQGFGTDISPEMIKNAKELHPDFNFATASCEAIPFDDNSMDIIMACCAYHHFPDVNAFAKEVNRLIKPNGNLYIAEVRIPPLLRHIVNIFVPLSPDGDVKFYSSNEIAKTFSTYGFELVNTTKQGYMQIVHLRKV